MVGKSEVDITVLEQMALKSIMDPHFVFNVINSIQHFINTGDKESANHYLTDFAKIIRISSGFSNKRKVSLYEELEYLHLYLSFEQLRFSGKFTYEIMVSQELDTKHTLLDAMMIQPFVENAIWQGLLPAGELGHLQVKIDLDSKSVLRIEIIDNGIGIKKLNTGDNLLIRPIDPEGSTVLRRLIHMNSVAGGGLYLRYRHLYPEKKNKGTVVEYLLPIEVSKS